MTRFVLISGFGWTGSGAVIDDIRGKSGVAPFRNGFEEASLFKGQYSLYSIHRDLGAKGEAWYPPTFVWRVLTALAGSVDLQPSDIPAQERMNVKRNLLYRWDLGKHALMAAAFEFVEIVFKPDGKDYHVNQERFDQGFKFLIETLVEARKVRLKVRGDDIFIINNDPNSYNIDAAPYYGDVKSVVVYRDIADVCANLIKLGRLKEEKSEVTHFVKQHRQKLKKYLSAISEMSEESRSNVVNLSFEDYVRSADLRGQVRAFLGVEGMDGDSHLDPSVSQGNIGLGRELSDATRQQIDKGITGFRQDVLAKAAELPGFQWFGA